MAKLRTIFVCQSCGTKFPKWVGRCTGCNEWDTVVEETENAAPSERAVTTLSDGKPPAAINSVGADEAARIPSGSSEFDHVLGGGIVSGSLTLIGGDPGIGKSTLLLQVADYVARNRGPVLYVSGEESASQIRLRAERLSAVSERLFVYAENDLARILQEIGRRKPALSVIDSIQTVFHPDIPSAQGSVGQVRECAARLMHSAKQLNTPVFLIGHVTREGTIAGPRVLEHIVDTVLYFEGDRNNMHRVVRAVKNRFGAVNEIAVFEMRKEGLREVPNPSEIFLSERREKSVGSVVACGMEGTRPMLVEIQALVSRQTFGYPQRTAAGMEQKRLALIAAVLERVADFPLSQHDIFLNVAGGLRVDEPAMDLPAACAVLSSLLNRPIDRKTCAMGEIGLTGEVRSVSFLEPRLKEARKMGFTRVLLSSANARQVKSAPGFEVSGIEDVEGIVKMLFD